MVSDDVVIKVRIDLAQTREALARAKSVVANTATGMQKDFRGIAAAEQNVYNQTKRLNSALGKSEFEGWALSVMFFGMALQRIFNQIWTSSQKVFQDVMHSVDGTVTGFDLLNGSLDYLWYSIGAALEPIAAWLAPIVEGIAEWVSENEGLTATIVVVGAVLGALFTIIGMGVLSINGLLDGWTKLSTGFKFIAASEVGAFFSTAWSGIAKAATATWSWASAQLALIAPWVALIAIFALAIALGISIGATWRQILDGFVIKWKLFGNMAKDAFLTIAEWAANSLGTVAGWINVLIKGFNSLTGKNIGLIDTSGLEKASASFRDQRVALAGEYGRLLQQGSANEADAFKAFTSGWDTILKLISGKQQEVTSALTPDMTAFTSTPTEERPPIAIGSMTMNITQQSGESPQAFMERLMREMNKNLVK